MRRKYLCSCKSQRSSLSGKEAVLDKLQNIVTKDVATAEIQDSLLNAPGLGKEKLLTFVKERLVLQSDETEKKKLRDPLPKNINRDSPRN